MDRVAELKKIARLITSAIAPRYMVDHEKDGMFFGSTTGWANFAVQPLPGDVYRLYTFCSKRKLKKDVESEFDRLVKNLSDIPMTFVKKRTYYKFVGPMHLRDALNRDSGLRTRLIDALVKLISWGGTRMFNNQGVKFLDYEFTDLDSEYTLGDWILDGKTRDFKGKGKLADYLITKLKVPLSTFEHSFGELDTSESERISMEKHHRWIVYTEANVKHEPSEYFDLLDNVGSLVRRRQMGHLCYGKVMVVRTLKGRVMAEYRGDQADSIRLRSQSFDGSKAVIRFLLHELAHRQWDKFFDRGQQSFVRQQYYKSTRDQPTAADLGLEVGDVLADGESSWDIKKMSALGDSVLGELTETSNARRQRSVGKTFEISVSAIATSTDIDIVGKRKPKLDFSKFFPTSYSMKNPEEMYCELFSFYVLRQRLDAGVVDWMDRLHDGTLL